MAEEKKTTLKEANELARTIFNSMPYEQRKRLGAPDDRLREINALIEKGDYLSMAHLKKRKKELEDWLIKWYKEICKESLQVPETSKENDNSFTNLEVAAIDYADYARKQPKDYAISAIANYDHGCIDGFKAGAVWAEKHSKELSSDDLEEAAEEYSRNVSDGHNYRDLTCGFIAGAEWQAERLLKGSPMPEDTVIFQKGIEEGKRLMMEEAIEASVNYYENTPGGSYVEKVADILNSTGVRYKDKVKVIIIKED